MKYLPSKWRQEEDAYNSKTWTLAFILILGIIVGVIVFGHWGISDLITN